MSSEQRGGEPDRFAHLVDQPVDVTDALLAHAVRRLDDAVVIADADGAIVFWNATAERVLGWRAHPAPPAADRYRRETPPHFDRPSRTSVQSAPVTYSSAQRRWSDRPPSSPCTAWTASGTSHAAIASKRWSPHRAVSAAPPATSL